MANRETISKSQVIGDSQSRAVAAAALNSISFSSAQANAVTLTVHVLALGAGKKATLKLQSSDTNANWTDVSSPFVYGDVGVDAVDTKGGVYRVAYFGKKKNFRAVITPSGLGTIAATVAISVRKDYLDSAPADRQI